MRVWYVTIICLACCGNGLAQKSTFDILASEDEEPTAYELMPPAEKAALHLQWLQQQNIPLKQLPLSRAKEQYFNCDSELVLKTTHGDTITYYSSASITYLDTNSVKEYLYNNPQWGLTQYISGVNYQGNIAWVSLAPHHFTIRNDSLFELETFYRISADSVDRIYEKIFAGTENDSLWALLASVTCKQFKLIFHPKLFRKGAYTQNSFGDSIVLNSVWSVNGLKYYHIFIYNHDGDSPTAYAYLFDENYHFVGLDGCLPDLWGTLTNDRKISPR